MTLCYNLRMTLGKSGLLPPISSDAANFIFTWSNVALVVGAILALLGTLGVFWAGGIRERYGDERLASAEAKVAQANADAAESRKEAELAKLQTEKLKQQLSWRQLSEAQEREIAGQLAGLRFSI